MLQFVAYLRLWVGGSAVATATRQLYGRALGRTERTEHAAVARPWPKQRVAAVALVEVNTGIGRHDLGRRDPTDRASNYGFHGVTLSPGISRFWHRPVSGFGLTR